MTTYDAAVVGLGAMGSAAAYQLASRGQRVLGLEAFDRGHTLGSSGGLTRVIRLAYYEHPDYVPLLRRAWDLWRELAAASGEDLLLETGGLYVGPPEGELFTGSLRSAREHALAHEVLDARAIGERFPMFRVAESWRGLFEPKAGLLRPERCIEANLRLAEASGAELRFGERVRSWRADGAGVAIVSDRGAYAAERLVIAAGAWIADLVPELAPLLSVERVPLFWFEPIGDPGRLAPERLPVYIVDGDEDGAFYGFPYLADQGLKVARHHSGVVCDPDTVDRSAKFADEERVRRFLRSYLPSGDGPLRSTKVCLYTNTPDLDFVIDRRADAPVAYASACSGHGFKFASVVGEILADLVVDERTREPIGFLSASRFARTIP